jgi:hypothetical protein
MCTYARIHMFEYYTDDVARVTVEYIVYVQYIVKLFTCTLQGFSRQGHVVHVSACQ